MAGLNTFTNVTKDMIAKVLKPLGFEEVDLKNTHEVTFSKVIEFEGADTIVRVYTGILKDTGESRPAGEDAIRVCLARFDPQQGRIRVFKTLQTVRRIGTWARHLRERIDGIGTGLVPPKPKTGLSEEDLLGIRKPDLPAAKDVACPLCGAHMVGPKQGKNGRFFGCSRFPTCRGARNIGD